MSAPAVFSILYGAVGLAAGCYAAHAVAAERFDFAWRFGGLALLAFIACAVALIISRSEGR